MEKRFLSFLWVSIGVVFGYMLLQQALIGPPPAKRPKVAIADPGDPAPAQPRERDDALADTGADAHPPTVVPRPPLQPTAHATQWTLGSLDPQSGYAMLVTTTTRGAGIERIELNSSRYRELEPLGGYLGNLALESDKGRGCRVTLVGAGTPAALAHSRETKDLGIRGPILEVGADGSVQEVVPGDLIRAIDGQPVKNPDDFLERMRRTRPGQVILIQVSRSEPDGEPQVLTFEARLVAAPLQLLRPEPPLDSKQAPPTDNQPSLLLGVHELGDQTAPVGSAELTSLPSLRNAVWSVRQLPDVDGDFGPGLEFRYRLTGSDLEAAGLQGEWEIIKRYRLGKRLDTKQDPAEAHGYCLRFELELHNLGDEPGRIAYQLDGPSGLTDEGWWYSYKVHPRSFGAAGARDVIWRQAGGRHELFLCREITTHAEKHPKSPDQPMLLSQPDAAELTYTGCDGQYFTAALLPDPDQQSNSLFHHSGGYTFRQAAAHIVGPPDEKLKKRSNVTARLTSTTFDVAPGEAQRQRFLLFAGPKSRPILEQFGLGECIVYGWFKVFAKPMVGLLHILYWISGSISYGLAIVLLTVLVRGLMFPFGRQMALNAQKMQELAPEIKKLTEKYKDDLAKRSQAQQELFKKHKYNPFSGCLVVFFQLPVFVGLYRALSVDIELRQAPLLSWLPWCQNLAGPDKLLNWESWMPRFLGAPEGWLGPYLNILPFISIALMLVHQKLFTPPPQDEQQKQQQQIMKYMMIFMGVMFHKIASGLCIYFIASSLWGLAERKMLPKPKPVKT